MSIDSEVELRRLGKAVRDLRKQLGVSQESFAEKCDLHRTYIGQVERGEKNLSFMNIIRIANALKIKPSDLLREAGL